MFKRILVATDFSDSAYAAWQVATSLAKTYQGDLVLVHVQSPLPAYGLSEGALVDLQRLYVEQQRWLEAELSKLVAEAKTAGVDAVAQIRTGVPAESIVEAAQEAKAELIVVGTHGRKGLERLVLGSVAERVVREAPCPVLTVKAQSTETQRKAA